MVQHTKAEGGSELQFHMQTGKLHIRSDKQTAFPQAPLRWMGWDVGGNSRTGQQVSSFVAGLSKRISAFLRLEAFLREYFYQKAIILTNMYMTRCMVIKSNGLYV